MSYVTMCDRCKKIIRTGDNVAITRRRYSSRIHIIWDKNHRTETVETHLCSECMKDLERWLKNEN